VLTAWLHLTNSCNLRCGYCYLQKSGEAMSPAIARAAIEATVREARQHGYPAVALKYAGGEASLRMDLVEIAHAHALEQCARHGLTLYAGLLSNGTTLTARKLASIRRLGLGLMISLDGLAAAHDANRPTIGGAGSAQAARSGIERAVEAGIRPDISITVTAASVSGLPDLLRWLLECDLPFSISFYRENQHSAAGLQPAEQQLIAGLRLAYAEIARRPPPWSLLGALLDRTDLSQPHARPCPAGHSYLVFDQHGRVASCQMTIDQPVADLRTPNLLNAIRLDPRGPQNLTIDDKPDCRSCDWRYWCAGGCPVSTLRATGRADQRSPNCAIYRSLYPDVLRLEGQRLLHWHRAG
jgi:uncharacterized protein